MLVGAGKLKNPDANSSDEDQDSSDMEAEEE